MLKLFFLFSPVVFGTVATAIECLTESGYQTSSSAVRCVECELIGYLDADGECVNDEVIIDDEIGSSVITTPCEQYGDHDYCVIFDTGTCEQSVFGTLCQECNFAGYLAQNTIGQLSCHCYSKHLDPKKGCLPSDRTLATNDITTIQADNIVAKRFYCDAYQSTQYGCYAKIDATGHRFGDPNPPIPHRCCVENYGPPPGELTEDLLTDGLVDQFEECNTKGGYQVDALPGETRAFRTCSNHGNWNLTTRECDCHRGWALELVGDDLDGNDILSCVACSPLWGPDSYDAASVPPFCSKIYTPNPFTGVDEECGGRGKFVDDHCSCFGNSTYGYWGLINITKAGVTMESCGQCLSGT
jgi:hypothetical protein